MSECKFIEDHGGVFCKTHDLSEATCLRARIAELEKERDEARVQADASEQLYLASLENHGATLREAIKAKAALLWIRDETDKLTEPGRSLAIIAKINEVVIRG